MQAVAPFKIIIGLDTFIQVSHYQNNEAHFVASGYMVGKQKERSISIEIDVVIVVINMVDDGSEITEIKEPIDLMEEHQVKEGNPIMVSG